MKLTVAVSAHVALLASAAFAQTSFVNWESPHVSPIDLTSDGTRLLVVNTADNRLEVFAVTDFGLQHSSSIPVGLDPVSVRARTSTEAWVVNHVSDSVSIVDLATGTVIATLHTGDEPADVVFAGTPQRAFVSVSQLNQIKVFDPMNLAAAPIVLEIHGEDPRALATDGVTVYAAIFESGNGTSILGEDAVSSTFSPYPSGVNPPPNDGSGFDPPIAPGLPAPPEASLIIGRDADGIWRDVNDADWSAAVTWDLHDHDLAIVNADTLSVSYATGLMNLNMAVAAFPGGGATVVGTEATNLVRFEPNLAGTFVRVVGAAVPAAGQGTAVVDLNAHLDYDTATVSQAVRDESIGDPRGIAWRAAGDRAFITGMGSNNVIVVDPGFARVGRIEVGEGPTGVVIDDPRQRVYVLNKFEATVSILDAQGLTEIGRISFYDPTPDVIRQGRPLLYDTHRTSGLGQAACASCHVDGRMDQISWDLGNPTGVMKPFNQVCNLGLGGCEDWHPMKGPMATQTLVGMIGTEPFHWRGDREELPAFNGAFESLLGDDTVLTAGEMSAFLAFAATLTPPPNPVRQIDGSLPLVLPKGGSPLLGEFWFEEVALDLAVLSCRDCHAAPAGTNGELVSGSILSEAQSMKVPQLRNMYEKTGFDSFSGSNNRGFGFTHDGSVDSLLSFLEFDGFLFLPGDLGDLQRADVTAFLMCFAEDTHAAVGLQATMPGPTMPGQRATTAELIGLAASGAVGLVAKGVVDGEARGFTRLGSGLYQSDRADEILTLDELFALATPASPLTYTAVPVGSALRIGVDRDLDGFFDGDERDAGSDPANPNSTPDNVVLGDLNGDLIVGIADLLQLLGAWGPCGGCIEDLDGDGMVGITDFQILLENWG